MDCVLQSWVTDLTFMQQTVLLCALRGPDGLPKEHVAKYMLRWYRRCVLISAFDNAVIQNPFYSKGGSFTGPSITEPLGLATPEHLGHLNGGEIQAYTGPSATWHEKMNGLLTAYLKTVDEMPHHFQLHFMHAAQIVGYKHPDRYTREWWAHVYTELVNDMHLFPESMDLMDKRLGDSEKAWRAREHASPRAPGDDTVGRFDGSV